MDKNKKKASLKDVASYVGVSTSLVSFVLNGKGRLHRVSEETIAKIKKAAEKLNYQPNSFAKSLREGKSRVIGVVLSDISNPFFSMIARYLEDEAEKYGYSILFASSDENRDRAEKQIAHLVSRGADGIILVPCEKSEKTVEAVLETGKPLILIDRYFPTIRTNYVCLNNREVSRLATEHLLTHGFSHPGVIAYDTTLQHMQDRVNGYKQAMTEAGKAGLISESRVKEANLHNAISGSISRMLAEGVDSLLFATNNIATEALKVIKGKGIRIPEDLGIIGFDGGNAFELFHVPVSYIRQPISLLAQKAVEIIMDEILMGEKMTHQVEVQGSLVITESSIKSC
ncbi:MAG: LacI family DNA-binding transcriptional regulator [Bacteroidales bacterium]|nr:LacI family DNA-binding transcriptional regulator [Bacteroidales bacterium]